MNGNPDSLNGLPEVDRNFLAEQNEGVRLHEKFANLIDRVHGEELGRAIMIRSKSPEANQSPTGQVIGYILPTIREGNQHLIVMRDGTMVVVGPRYDDEEIIKKYKNFLSPNELPIHFEKGTILEILDSIISDYRAYIELIFRNDRPEDSERVKQAIENAFNIAGELKMKRGEARQDSTYNFVDLAARFLNEGDQDNSNQTPPNPPSSV